MRVFAYSLREYDEKKYMDKFCEELGFEYAYTSEYPSLENAELARGYDAVSIITNPMSEALLDKYKELGISYIATRTIGFEHMNTPYMKKIGLRGTNAPYSPNSVANYTIMMMLMACRNINYIMDKARLQDYTLMGKCGKELSLCTVGVIGTGRIGETVLRHLSGFGCKLLAYDPYPKDRLKDIAEYVDLDTILKESDIVTLHVPGMESSRHMIDQAAIAKMKDGVILINAARGMLVDTAAMIEALENGKIGFAALDTIEDEGGIYYLNFEDRPLKSHDRAVLNAMPNVMLSPHMAFYTEQAVSDMVGNAMKGLDHFEKGEKNPFEVDYAG